MEKSDICARSIQNPEVLGAIDAGWEMLFMLDLVFAIYCLGMSRYSSRPWHLFDTAVTLLHFVGIIGHLSVSPHDGAYQLSVLRFVGLARSLHVIKWLTLNR